MQGPRLSMTRRRARGTTFPRGAVAAACASVIGACTPPMPAPTADASVDVAVAPDAGDESAAPGWPRDPHPPAAFASVVTVATDGARPSFSPDGRWIYYDRRDEQRHWQVRRVPTAGGPEECLTCGRAEMPGHNGAARVHPGGRYVAFTSEIADHVAFPPDSGATTPGGGFFHDIVVLDLESGAFERVRQVRGYPTPGLTPADYDGTLFVRFSEDGHQLAFADVESGPTPGLTPPSRFANYRIGLADFVEGAPPRLANERYFNPGGRPELFEVQGFTHDGAGIYTACTPYAGQDDYALDLCRFDVAAGTIRSVVATSGLNGEPAEYEEHGEERPQGDLVAYIGSEPHGISTTRNFLAWLRSDLWLVRPDGSDRRQVTFYNVPGHPEADAAGGRVMVSELAWSHDGRYLVALVYFVGNEADASDDVRSIKLFELAG